MAEEIVHHDTTHFGFKTIPAHEKVAHVGNVFSQVAERYDIMNDVMSGGLQRVWKAQFIKQLRLKPGMQVLDLAGGTGDISFRMLHAEPDIHVTLSDINEAMLNEGVKRAVNRNIDGIKYTTANAECLPFNDQSMDLCTIAFGIRNVTNIDKALIEIHRVLKFGGRFACLEFSPVQAPVLKKLYDAYSFNVIPKLGEWIAGDSAPYHYLVESIRMFPDALKFAEMMNIAGFANVSYLPMTGGIVHIHTGWKV